MFEVKCLKCGNSIVVDKAMSKNEDGTGYDGCISILGDCFSSVSLYCECGNEV